MAIVPLPQHGSYKQAGPASRSSVQPTAANMAAASVSFKGASPLSKRQPRLNKGSPEVSKDKVMVSWVKCT